MEKRRDHFRGIALKDKIVGTAYSPDSVQATRLPRYHTKLEAGRIFGSKTGELLPYSGEITERIDAYFSDVDSGFENLSTTYGLDNHCRGEFPAIKEEATKLMWSYGIKTDLFADDQRGLLLLGVASTTLHMRGQEGDGVEKERKRMKRVVRMLAQQVDGETLSTKVPLWKEQAGAKAYRLSYSNPEHAALYRSRQEEEDLYSNNSPSEWLRRARIHEDPVKTAELNSTYIDLPHIVRMRERIGDIKPDDVTWIVTNLTLKFSDVFPGAGAFCSGKTAVVANDIASDSNMLDQQHELVHAKTEHRASVYLGRGLATEADAERNTDVPNTYAPQMLLGYYVDDAIDYFTSYKVGYRVTEKKRIAAAINRRNGQLNSSEEREWNKRLLHNFGLDGYLAYYSVHSDAPTLNQRITDNLLTVNQGAYRLQSYADYYHEGTPLPGDLYKEEVDFETIQRNIISLWDKSYNINTIETLEYNPHEFERQFSFDQTLAFMQRMDAGLFSDVILPSGEREAMAELSKIVWKKKGRPLLPSNIYDYPRDATQLRIKKRNHTALKQLLVTDPGYFVLRNSSYSFFDAEDIESGVTNKYITTTLGVRKSLTAQDALGHLDPFPGENDEALYHSLLASCWYALQHDQNFRRVNITHQGHSRTRFMVDGIPFITLGQKEFAEALLSAHKRISQEEQGNTTRIMTRIKNEVIKPFLYNYERVEEVIHIPDFEGVYYAVTSSQQGFDGKIDYERKLSTNDIYTMIEATRLALGAKSGVPTERDINPHDPYISTKFDLPSVTMDSDSKKVVVQEKYGTKSYDLNSSDPKILKQNLLIFIYGYLEKQLRVYGESITEGRTRRQQDEHMSIAKYLEGRLNYPAHFGVHQLYQSMSFASRIISGNEEMGGDFPLSVLKYSHIFDLEDISGIHEDFARLVDTLRNTLGDTVADRVEKVVMAGCKFSRDIYTLQEDRYAQIEKEEAA